MNVLVTGGSGYVGSSTVRGLAAGGHNVTIYDNLSTGCRKLSAGFELVEGDVADKDKLDKYLKGADAVMHFAASAYVGESVVNPRKYFKNNVESALALIDAVVASHVRLFVFSSSCAVYGVPGDLPIAETHPKEPINPYGATKLFFEQVLSAFAVSHGLRSVCLRYFNAAGSHPSGEVGEIHTPETHLIPLAIRAAFGTAAPLTVYGSNLDTPDGTCIRDYIHVADLASAHVQALEYLKAGGPSAALNLGTGKGTSVAEIMQLIEATTNHKVPCRFAPPRHGDPPVLFADARKARELLGWSPQYDIRQIIASAVNWEEQLPGFLANSATGSRSFPANGWTL